MLVDKIADASHLTVIVPGRGHKCHDWLQPELCRAVGTKDMHVRWLDPIPGVERHSVAAETQHNRTHRDAILSRKRLGR